MWRCDICRPIPGSAISMVPAAEFGVKRSKAEEEITMKMLGNLIWLICGGAISAFLFFVLGCLWCLSVLGIPIGLQCFKFAKLALCPFGKEVETACDIGEVLLNFIWWFLGGIEMAILFVGFGVVCCLTIVGLPFGLQYFKFAKLSLFPLGTKIRSK